MKTNSYQRSLRSSEPNLVTVLNVLRTGILENCWYPFSWHILYKPNSIKPDLIIGPIHVLYYFFYCFKHDPSPCNILEKLRECDLEGIGRFLSDFLHEPSLCVLPSEQGILVAPLAHGGGFVLEISTLKEPLFSG